jgi:hypothetical protein
MRQKLGCAHEMPKDDERQVKWKQQRKERGFDDTELWSLDITIAEFVLPRLKAFRDKLISTYPGNMSIEGWRDILQSMIDGFEIIAKEDFLVDKKKERKARKAVKLFAEYYFHLWD